MRTKGVPAGTPGRIAIPVAADSDAARRVAMRLVDETGFDPFDAGVPADSWRQQPGTPAYCTEVSLEDLGPALAAADRAEAPRTRDRLMERFPPWRRSWTSTAPRTADTPAGAALAPRAAPARGEPGLS